MAQVELRISSKIQKVTGRSEIMIRFFQGNTFDLYAKSEVFVSPEYFEYYINREKTEKPAAAAGEAAEPGTESQRHDKKQS